MSRIPVRFGSFFSDVNAFLKFFCRFHCNVEFFLQKPLRCPCISVDFNAFSIYNANNRMTRENLKSKFQKQHPKCQKDNTPNIRQQHQRRLLKQKNVRGAIKTLRIDARRLMLLRLNTALAPGCDEPPHGMQSVSHRCRPGAPVEKDRAQFLAPTRWLPLISGCATNFHDSAERTRLSPRARDVLVDSPRARDVLVDSPRVHDFLVVSPRPSGVLVDSPRTRDVRFWLIPPGCATFWLIPPGTRDVLVDSPRARDVLVDSSRVRDVLVDSPRARDVLVDSPRARGALVDSPRAQNVLVDSRRVRDFLVDSPRARDVLVDFPRAPQVLVDSPRARDALVDSPRARDALVDSLRAGDVLVDSPLVRDFLVDSPRVRDVMGGFSIYRKEPPISMTFFYASRKNSHRKNFLIPRKNYGKNFHTKVFSIVLQKKFYVFF